MPSLIQEITINGEDVHLLNIFKSSFHLSTELDCPQIVLDLYERNSLADLLQIKFGLVVKIHFSDLITNDFEQEIEFKVLSVIPTPESHIKRLNCLESNVFEAIKKQPKGVFFRKKPVNYILKQLFPNIKKFDIDSFPILGDFHVPSGSQVNREIKEQLCRQYAAMCWIANGTLHFKKVVDLFNQDSVATYTNNPHSKDAYRISEAYPAENQNKERQILREYIGYHPEAGFISGGKIGHPKKVTNFDNKTILNNLAIGSKRVLDITVPGRGALEPGQNLDLEWISNNPEMPINESLPNKALVTRINHFVRGERHKMRVGLSIAIAGQ